MTVVRGFSITIGSGLGFGLFGVGTGCLLGSVAPDYYRTVFRIPAEVSFDAVQTGLGLGLTQGIPAGLIIGLVIVVSAAWCDSRPGV